MKLRIKLCIASMNLCMCLVAQAHEWPVIELPPRADTFAVGDQFTANGLPMRAKGFRTKDMQLAQAVEWFKRSLGQPLVENKFGTKVILGRAQGGYYVTVQIENMRDDGFEGVKGMVAVSDVAAFNASKSQQAIDVSRWLDRWPSGTQEMNRMVSQDFQKKSVYVSLRNGHSVELNRQALIDVLQQDGLALERESVGVVSDRMSLYFKGLQKEAIATIAKTKQGNTEIVINTITHQAEVKK